MMNHDPFPALRYQRQSMHKVDSGRIFARTVSGGQQLIVGAVELPDDTVGERVYAARLNSSLWIELGSSKPGQSQCPTAQVHGEVAIKESNLTWILKTFQWESSAVIKDMCSIFIRRSVLPSSEIGKAWFLVCTALRTGNPLLQQDGVYELRADGYTPISGTAFAGYQPCSIFCSPMWGPDGNWGMSTSMELSYYKSWIDQEQESNARRDPAYAEFCRRLTSSGASLGDYYDAAAHRSHKAACDRVVREMRSEGVI